MPSLEELFCSVDDFCQKQEGNYHQLLLGSGVRHRRRAKQLCLSEIMTIIISFHQSHYRNFKAYYQQYVCEYWQADFPFLVSYQRFVQWMPSTLLPLCGYLQSKFGTCTGISFMDATSLKVCHNRRISQHQVFSNMAARGKTSVDWFFGFKLHLVVNDCGELLNITVTPGNTDDLCRNFLLRSLARYLLIKVMFLLPWQKLCSNLWVFNSLPNLNAI
jgi:Transposase DDE domain